MKNLLMAHVSWMSPDNLRGFPNLGFYYLIVESRKYTKIRKFRQSLYQVIMFFGDYQNLQHLI